jgi:TRAP-type mannitol/chloroaromatic compound transport system permease small subunit
MSVSDTLRDVPDELLASRRSDRLILPADMPAWMAVPIRAIDGLNRWIGRIVSWLVLPLTAAMIYEIAGRYFFASPTVWAYDISRMLYGAYFMLGAAYALSKCVHLRADFLYGKLSPQTQGRLDAALYVFLYFPAMIVFFVLAWQYAATAVVRGERGMDTAWMPLLGPIKSVLPAAVALLVLQGVSEFLKSLYAATRGRWPLA